MGFWSRSNAPPSAPAADATPSPPPADTPAPHSAPSIPPPTPGSLDARNAAADAEFAALLKEFESETSHVHDHPRTSPPSAPHLPVTPPTPAQPAKTPSGIPERMSCLTAFDEMYYCYSLGGQFLNVYRYGNLRDCSEKSRDWRFCMKSRMYPEDERRKMVREHYREKERRVREGRSSEEVWEMRGEVELLKEPFSGKVEDLKADRLD